jgi:hypothetical protein
VLSRGKVAVVRWRINEIWALFLNTHGPIYEIVLSRGQPGVSSAGRRDGSPRVFSRKFSDPHRACDLMKRFAVASVQRGA